MAAAATAAACVFKASRRDSVHGVASRAVSSRMRWKTRWAASTPSRSRMTPRRSITSPSVLVSSTTTSLPSGALREDLCLGRAAIAAATAASRAGRTWTARLVMCGSARHAAASSADGGDRADRHTFAAARAGLGIEHGQRDAARARGEADRALRRRCPCSTGRRSHVWRGNDRRSEPDNGTRRGREQIARRRSAPAGHPTGGGPGGPAISWNIQTIKPQPPTTATARTGKSTTVRSRKTTGSWRRDAAGRRSAASNREPPMPDWQEDNMNGSGLSTGTCRRSYASHSG